MTRDSEDNGDATGAAMPVNEPLISLDDATGEVEAELDLGSIPRRGGTLYGGEEPRPPTSPAPSAVDGAGEELDLDADLEPSAPSDTEPSVPAVAHDTELAVPAVAHDTELAVPAVAHDTELAVPAVGVARDRSGNLQLDEAEEELELAVDPHQLAQRQGTLFAGSPTSLELPTLRAQTAEHKAYESLPNLAPAEPGLPGETPSTEVEAVGAPSEKRPAKIVAVEELVKQIEKTVKTLNLYDGKGEVCERTIDLAYRHLSEVLRNFGEIRLSITPFEFLMDGQSVYTAAEERRGLSYRIFRDGLRQLEFLPTIEGWEFAELIGILRAVQTVMGEDDAVTMLWQRNLPGIRYHAIDYFLEGMLVGETDELQQQVEQLVAIANRPLHELRQTSVAREVAGQLGQQILQEAKAQRAQLIARLREVPFQEDVLDQLRLQGRNAAEDLWRRAMKIIGRILLAGKGEAFAGMLVQVIEQMMLEGRWEILEASCRAMGELLQQVRGQDNAAPAEATLEAALNQIVRSDKLPDLRGILTTCSPEEFSGFAALVIILPRTADPLLIDLLCRLPEGAVQEKLADLLRQRGVDLTDYLRQKLRSDKLKAVIAAIHELHAIGSKQALAAVKSAVGHPDHRARIEVLRLLGDKVDESLAPQLIAALTVDNRDLRDLSLALLRRLRAPRHTPQLLATIRKLDLEQLTSQNRKKLFGLLIAWGGAEAYEYVIQTVTAMNPLRRSRIESLRQDMLDALRAIGGKRSQQLLAACLDQRPSKAVRTAIEQVLEGMEQQR